MYTFILLPLGELGVALEEAFPKWQLHNVIHEQMDTSKKITYQTTRDSTHTYLNVATSGPNRIEKYFGLKTVLTLTLPTLRWYRL